MTVDPSNTPIAAHPWDRFFAARRWKVAGTLILLAALLRVVYFSEIVNGPCVRYHLWENSDMNYFHRLALDIAGGDWLVERPPLILHAWHREFADKYFSLFPERRAQYENVATADGRALDVAYALLFGTTKRFRQEPLYPYMVAVTYVLFAPDPRWVFAWQMALGVVGVWLVFEISRRAFGETAGALAGLLYALCGPVMFHEGILLRDSTVCFAGLCLTWMALRALDKDSARSWFVFGLATGLAFLLKAILIPVSVGSLAVLFWQRRSSMRQVLACAAAMALGGALMLAPLVARDIAVGDSPRVPFVGAALMFVCGNAKGFSPTRGWSVDLDTATRVFGENQGRVLPCIRGALQTHSSMDSYLQLLAAKIAAPFGWYEATDNVSFYSYRLFAPVLRWGAPLTGWLLCPLGVVGMILAIRRASVCGPLYLLVAAHAAPMIVFFTLSRFRMAMLAALLPFAALTLARIADWRPKRRLAAASTTLATGLLLVVNTLLPRGPLPLVRIVDMQMADDLFFNPREEDALMAGNMAQVERILHQSLRGEPPETRAIPSKRPVRDHAEYIIVRNYAARRISRAEALTRLGRQSEAQTVGARGNELLDAALNYERTHPEEFPEAEGGNAATSRSAIARPNRPRRRLPRAKSKGPRTRRFHPFPGKAKPHE